MKFAQSNTARDIHECHFELLNNLVCWLTTYDEVIFLPIYYDVGACNQGGIRSHMFSSLRTGKEILFVQRWHPVETDKKVVLLLSIVVVTLMC